MPRPNAIPLNAFHGRTGAIETPSLPPWMNTPIVNAMMMNSSVIRKTPRILAEMGMSKYPSAEMPMMPRIAYQIQLIGSMSNADATFDCAKAAKPPISDAPKSVYAAASERPATIPIVRPRPWLT